MKENLFCHYCRSALIYVGGIRQSIYVCTNWRCMELRSKFGKRICLSGCESDLVVKRSKDDGAHVTECPGCGDCFE